MTTPEHFGEQQLSSITWSDFITTQLEGGNFNLPPVHGHPYGTSNLEGNVMPPELSLLGEPVVDVRTLAPSQRQELDPEVRGSLLGHLANEGTILRGTFSLQPTQPGYYPFISADTTEGHNTRSLHSELLLRLPAVVGPDDHNLSGDAVNAAGVKRGMLRFVADVQVKRMSDGQNKDIVVAQVRDVYAAESPYAGAGDTLPWPGDSVIMQGQVTQYNPGEEYSPINPGAISLFNPEMGEQTIEVGGFGPLTFGQDLRGDRTVGHLYDSPRPGDVVQVRAFRTLEGEWAISPSIIRNFAQKSKQIEVIRLVQAGDQNAIGSLDKYDAFTTQMTALEQAATPEEVRARHAALLRQAINPDRYARQRQPYTLTSEQLEQVNQFVHAFGARVDDRQRSLAMRSEILENNSDILAKISAAEAALEKDILGMTFVEFAKAVEEFASGNYNITGKTGNGSSIVDVAEKLVPHLYSASMFTFYGKGITTILNRTPSTGPGTGVISRTDGTVLRQMLVKIEPRARSYQGMSYDGRVDAQRLGAYARITRTLSISSLQEHNLDTLITDRLSTLIKEPFEQKGFRKGPATIEDFAVVKDRRLLQAVLELAPGVIARLRQSVDSKPLPDDSNSHLYKSIISEQQRVAALEDAMILIQQRQ